jgi:hypothetical protein
MPNGVYSSEGGSCSICPNPQRKMPHTCKFYLIFSHSFICTCGHTPFQRPLVGKDSHMKYTNEFSGRTSNAWRISAKKFVRTYEQMQRQFSVTGNVVPTPSLARFCPLRFLLVLTFKSLAVSLRTTRFNIQNFYMVLALR